MAQNDGQTSPVTAVLGAYLSQYDHASEITEDVILKTTEQIESEIQDMVEPKEGEVATLMLEAGYQVIYRDGRHGWALRYRRK